MSSGISVVVPCHNDGKFLSDAVESASGITGSGSQLIIVDDGSTDPFTISEIARFELTGAYVIRQKNLGLGAARNAGIRFARGDYIIPLDCDNRLREAYFRGGQAILDDEPNVGVVYSDAEYFGERQGPWCVGEFDVRRLVRMNYIDACALFRKSLWEDLGGYDERMPKMGLEDWDFWLRAAVRGWDFRHLAEIGFDYRVRHDSMITQTYGHAAELLAYIFGKRELNSARLIRDLDREVEGLKLIVESRGSRMGRRLADGVNRMRRLVKAPFALPKRGADNR